MKPDSASGDAFVKEDFSNWKKNKRLQTHVGNHDSAHNQAQRKCEALMKLKQHIKVVFQKHSDQTKRDYRIHLTATIECIRFLLRQGLAFHGDDESHNSNNQEIDRVFKNARGNLKLVAPKIQKDIVRAAASETTKVIIDDLGDDLFVVLVDEARDISVKEQMAVCLCHNILVPNMNDIFVTQGRSRRKIQKEKLLRLAEFYPREFSSTQLLALDSHLENFILDMRLDDQFSNINGISGLSQKLVETKKYIVYPLVFLLLKLALILPVATISV
ncbi:uncharacterized protein [Arachis hypogaea]|uniref:uncharacterized protein n=1 Tax=Arachis hypogaea TaxID=3818 RepID=UPI000DECE717|nr:uncharacterized protein LOC112779995 [Arachis hypogaea]